MERPALQRLLEDIRHGLIDVVVVYKVDRLTRSLADFAKMVEVFDAQGVSFGAVTQQFNTTTSMGRLTLNVLLSFAQFEREVTGERIRDKIAASKRKGIWMGGCPSIGYDVCDRRLVVNQAEAASVRQIYQRYLKAGFVPKLKKELDRDRVVSKIRLSRKGNRSGGQSFSRGALYELLSNPIYIGEIRHKQERHPGQHKAILERALWEKVETPSGSHRSADRASNQSVTESARWKGLRRNCRAALRPSSRERPSAVSILRITSTGQGFQGRGTTRVARAGARVGESCRNRCAEHSGRQGGYS
jgi:site-specific DNA recombinase